MDENENETAGRGMIANREIKEGDELFTLPVDLLLTKDAAKKVHTRGSAPYGACFCFYLLALMFVNCCSVCDSTLLAVHACGVRVFRTPGDCYELNSV